MSDAEILQHQLENVRGIGPKMSKRLLENLGSIEAVHAASPVEIATTAGISTSQARAIARELEDVEQAAGVA